MSPTIDPATFNQVTAWLDIIGIIVFAISGTLTASRKEMDVFGFILLATLTGVGGGTLRDMLLGATPVFWVTDFTYIGICSVVGIAMFFLAHFVSERLRTLLFLDAFGLALFAVLGAEKALVGWSPGMSAIVMGAITGTFGGLLRDIIAGEKPLLLHQEIYFTAALVAAGIFVACTAFGFQREIAMILGVLSGFLLRVFAIVYGWSLPRYKPRAGRKLEEVQKMMARDDQ